MVTIRVCSKLKQAENRLFLQIENSARTLNIWGAFIIPLALVGYEMIIANSYPTRPCGIIVNY